MLAKYGRIHSYIALLLCTITIRKNNLYLGASWTGLQDSSAQTWRDLEVGAMVIQSALNW